MQFTRDVNNGLSHQSEVNKYKDFLMYLYANFNPKSSGIDICVFKAKELGIKHQLLKQFTIELKINK